MALFDCDLCGQPATVHMTVINDGVPSERHLCPSHAQAEGLPPGVCVPPEQQITQGVVSNLRGTANFIKKYGRTPSSVQELREGMAMKGDDGGAEINDAQLAKGLLFIERTIRFVEAHGHLPQSREESKELEEDGQ